MKSSPAYRLLLALHGYIPPVRDCRRLGGAGSHLLLMVSASCHGMSCSPTVPTIGGEMDPLSFAAKPLACTFQLRSKKRNKELKFMSPQVSQDVRELGTGGGSHVVAQERADQVLCRPTARNMPSSDPYPSSAIYCTHTSLQHNSHSDPPTHLPRQAENQRGISRHHLHTGGGW